MFSKVKHNRGKDLRRKQYWVFGMKQRGNGLCYMELVNARNCASLLPIIYNHVAPETVIHSDLWRSYKSIPIVSLYYGFYLNSQKSSKYVLLFISCLLIKTTY